jgi:hypothetical protein
MTVLLIIVAIIALFFIIGLFSKKSYSIQREISIARAPSQVFNYVRFMKNQEQYNKWVMQDPQARKEYKGTDGAPGATFAWESQNKQVGKGEQELKNLREGEQVDFEIRFEKPFKGIASSRMVSTPAGTGETRVKWTFESGMNYPMNLMLLFMNMDKMLGKDLELSLSQLKSQVEKN